MFLKLRWLTPVHNEVSGRTVTKATFIQVEQNPDGSPMRIAGADGRMNDVPATPRTVAATFLDGVEYGAPVTFQKPCLGNLVVHCGKHQKAVAEVLVADGSESEPRPLADGTMSQCLRQACGVYIQADGVTPVLDANTGKPRLGANNVPLMNVELATADIHVYLGSNGGAVKPARKPAAVATVQIPVGDPAE